MNDETPGDAGRFRWGLCQIQCVQFLHCNSNDSKLNNFRQAPHKLEVSGNGATLRDANSGQKVDLDFSASTVQMDRLLNDEGGSPVELTARIRNGSGKDKLILIVIGGTGLTP